MKKQLSELLNGITFKFTFYSDGIASFSSTIMKDMMGNYKDFEIEVFTGNDGEFFSEYETFDSLNKRFQIFEVKEIDSGYKKNTQVLFHEKYKGND